MRVQHHHGHEGDVDDGEPSRNRHGLGFDLDLRQCHQFFAEHEGNTDGVDRDSQRSLPPEGKKHKLNVPSPLASDHQNRWSSEVRKHAADGNVDEQRPKGSVHETLADATVVVGLLENERRDRHGRGLRDEAAEQRPNDEGNCVKAQRLREWNELGECRDRPIGEVDDGLGSRHNHDHKHEGGLRVVDAIQGVIPLQEGNHLDVALHPEERQHEESGPEAEDHLNLREEVEDVLHHRSLWKSVRPVGELLNREGVDNGESEEDRREDLDVHCNLHCPALRGV